MKSNAVQRPIMQEVDNEVNNQPRANPHTPHRGFGPEAVRQSANGNGAERHSLRMYTEEEVSEMLQISLSQLRKWRMKQNGHGPQGPPFKKIGRLVRYPEQGLIEYINRK